MFRKSLTAAIALFLATILLAGCLPAQDKKGPKMGKLTYETINIPSEQFDGLNEGEFASWYEENHQAAGVHSLTQGEYLYILLSAGEKPTGGYYLEDLTLEGKAKEIAVKARLREPGKDDLVTMAITYPHLLARIAADSREPVLAGIEKDEDKKETGETKQDEDKKDPATHTDSGSYVGQIDRNSIEIKISGVPEEHAARAFRLDENLVHNFDKLGLNTGEQVLFDYIVNEHGQDVIIQIKKI